VLRVINYVNSHSSSGAEGEGPAALGLASFAGIRLVPAGVAYPGNSGTVSAGQASGEPPIGRDAIGVMWRNSFQDPISAVGFRAAQAAAARQATEPTELESVGRPGRSQCELPLGPKSTRNRSKTPVNDVDSFALDSIEFDQLLSDLARDIALPHRRVSWQP
jgi:hypothetical protein